MLNYNHIGVDAIVISNTNFKNVNMEEIKPFISSMTEASNKDSSSIYNTLIDCDTGEYLDFSSLSFILSKYNHKFPGLNNISFRSYSKNKRYNKIHATLPTILNGNNQYNLNNTTSIKKSIESLSKYCQDIGFKDFNLYDSNISKIELNTNVLIDHEFSKYKNVLDFMFHAINNRKNCALKNSSNLRYQNGFVVSNGNIQINFYNKKDIPDHDILVGGFPCQDYSVARTKAKGIQGKKGVLWWDIYETVKEKRPNYIVLENVDRLLISPSKQRGRNLGVMLYSLYKLGYTVEWRVINAAEYGYPQRRRVFIYANYKDTKHYIELDKFKPEDILYSKGFFARRFKVKEEDTDKIEK